MANNDHFFLEAHCHKKDLYDTEDTIRSSKEAASPIKKSWSRHGKTLSPVATSCIWLKPCDVGRWTLPRAPSAQTRPPFRKPSPGAWSRPGPRASFMDSQCRRGDDLSSPVLMLQIFSIFGLKGSVHKRHPEKLFQHSHVTPRK